MKTDSPFSLAIAGVAIAFLTGAPPAPGQLPPPLRIVPAPRLADPATEQPAGQPGEGQRPEAKQDGAAVDDGAAAAAAAKEDDLATALRKLDYDRSPEALLAATRSLRKGGAVPEVERFKLAVILGDWAAVGKALAALPAEDAAVAYGRLLDALAETAVPVGEVLKGGAGDPNEDPFERQQRLAQERMSGERKPSKPKPAPLLSEDFYALVDAAPCDLREENVKALAALVKTTLGEGGRKTLLGRLERGWKGLGGSGPEGRKLATRLLSALGWIADAAPFLPLKNEEWESADTMQLVFAMEYFTQTGIAERDERRLQRAAELCTWLMKTSRFGNYTRPQFRMAMDRLVQLLPALDPAEARTLIREQLFRQTATLADLISVIGELGQAAAKGKDLKARGASLGTQHLLLEALVAKQDQLPENVAVLVMNWLGEAEGCYRAGGAVAMEMTQAERIMMERYGMSRGNEVASLPTQVILDTAPPPELVRRLNPGLAQRVELTLLKVNILQPKEANLELLRQYVKSHPGLERDVCQDVLSGWVSKRTKPAESEQVKRMRAYGMYVPPQMQQAGSGIPLTRLRQNQNVQQFKGLLAQLREISPEPIDPALVVQSFMTLHSGAEVYRLEDIEAIFGPPEKMVRAELLELLEGMRGRLQEQWREPQAQQQAGTNRTEQETKDEVSRGYLTALELARRGIRAEDGDWSAFLTRGRLFYDASQYEFDRQIKLSDYVSLRDEAFASFRQAAEIYAGKLPSMPRGQWTIEPYQAWFLVMLGASDLAQLTISAARTDPGLKSIGDAMRALPGEAAGHHTGMFARMLGELFPRVPANVRQRFLHSGLKIIGEDHPAAGAATASLDYYRELLDEVRLKVEVDGPTRVGHRQPFGVFIGLEATRQLLRESGGFSKHLQNQGRQQQAAMGGSGGRAPQNLRDDFARNIHAALDETFEVVSLTFHDAAVKTIDLPREGWVETPLVYAVLRAKNAAVDRIPSIQIDMDFIDQPGQVVLPVMSQVQPLDARDGTVVPRPCGELQVAQTLDEREWREGRLVVEIQARGQGVIPALDEMFECEREGFELEASDGGMSVTEFVSDGSRRVPQADRNWQLTYRRKQGLRGPVAFRFPAFKEGIRAAGVEFKHYQDADLATIEPAAAAAGVKLPGVAGRGLGWLLALGACGVLAVVALAVFLRRGRARAGRAAAALELPADPTPFTALAFLRRIQRQHAARLAEGERDALRAQITELEAGFFRAGQSPQVDLGAVLRKWWQAVGN